jgi:hypothetical protein
MESKVKGLLFLNHGTVLGWVVNARPLPLYPREGPGTHCMGVWVGPTADLDGYEKSRPNGIRSLDRPARSESLYRQTGVLTLKTRLNILEWK